MRSELSWLTNMRVNSTEKRRKTQEKALAELLIPSSNPLQETHIWGRAILRNGFNTAAEFHNLLRECYTYQDSAEHTKLLDEQNAKLSCRADLRQQAFRARDDVKCAKYLQRQLEKGTLSEDMLSAEQRKLMVLFETRELDKRRRAANIAYMHGARSEDKVLSIEAIMTMNATLPKDRPVRR